MNIDKIKVPREIAKEEWKKYNDLLKKRKEKLGETPGQKLPGDWAGKAVLAERYHAA